MRKRKFLNRNLDNNSNTALNNVININKKTKPLENIENKF